MKRPLIVALVVVALIGLVVWFMGRGGGPSASDELTPQDVYGFDPEQCPGKTITMRMSDIYLRGILEEGQEFKAYLNWFRCNSIGRGDLVLYRFTNNALPVVRQVIAIPGDEIKVEYSKAMKAWTLSVNGEEVTANDAPYFFGGEMPPPLKLYEQAHDGKMGDNEVIVFSSFPPGFNDSGTFGAIALQDIVAKVEK